ncbi:TetR/AcrR family transcriptional regulator [Streptomyces sp. NBC_01003]|uniref:TetR/AcrR family transcriptional regulator n=1 Tax=Streptomyces sp. NBC_01003 TaxID=2903714 RepID=UPI00386ED26C|nr:TetR/AcrR family transcriptional regulator [Streptomyces sp. NBC_01003]
MSERVDPRAARTTRALERAIVELASQGPVARITVAELADRAGVTRATFYNRSASPLGLLIQVLNTDLDRGRELEEGRRAQGDLSVGQRVRMAIGEAADHMARFAGVYEHSLGDPAGHGVYEALVSHFAHYAMSCMDRCTHPALPEANREVIAQFVAHGFAGAIQAWMADDAVTKDDLVDAALACAPAWWT